MAEIFQNIIKEPFVWGLGLGLLVAGFLWFSAFRKIIDLKKRLRLQKTEFDDMKKHLYNQMSLSSKGNEETLKEIERIKRENENLRNNFSLLDKKPGRDEIRTLRVYDQALRLLYERSPGFAPAWQNAMREAEQTLGKAEQGFLPLVKRIFSPTSIAGEDVEETKSAKELRLSDVKETVEKKDKKSKG